MKNGMEKEDMATGRPASLLLDEKDRSILRLLQQDAKITIREIATQVHLSPTPVHERIRRMEEAGVIRQYAALLDPARIGKGLMVICYVSLKEHSRKAGASFIEAIRQMDEVTECYSISGQFDFMLKVVEEDMDAYYDFHVNKLSRIHNLEHVQSTFIMGVIKQTHRLL